MRTKTITLVLCALAAVSGTAVKVRAQSSSVKTVFIILMENHNWSSIHGNTTDAPYINNTLLPMAAHAEQYFNPPGLHPSLPNYLWLEAGDNFGIRDDLDPASHPLTTTDHLATQLQNIGTSWKTYQEDISGTTCPLTSVNKYAPKHNPFVYFTDVTDNVNANSATCIAHVRPYTEFANDLQTGNVTHYVFITPNQCNDMHDSCAPLNNSIKQGDTWLSTEVPKILASSAYKQGGALFITWDEGAGSSDGPIGMIVLSPFGKVNYSNTVHYDHSSTLKTFEEIFGVALLRAAANGATNDLGDLFPATPVTPAAPTNLQATAGTGQVSLTWSISNGDAAFNVKRSTTNGGPYTTIATGLLSPSHTDTTVSNGTTYFYVVTGVNQTAESGNSNQASATPGTAPPAPPTNLTATPGNAQVALAWTASSGATSYNVKRSTTNGGPYGSIASGVGVTNFTDFSVVNGTTYYYVVTAVNGGGESGNSNQASATPSGPLTAVYQINAGGPAVAPFAADGFFNGGATASVPDSINTSGVTNAAPMAVYQSWRESVKKPQTFQYSFTGLTAGASYLVRLHFSENQVTASGQRKMNVSINGTQVLGGFDIFVAAGGKNKAVVREFTVAANSSGQITIQFSWVANKNPPLVNGIEILH